MSLKTASIHIHTKTLKTLNKNERSRHVEEEGTNNEKYEEKNKIKYGKDTIKNIQDNRPHKNKMNSKEK